MYKLILKYNNFLSYSIKIFFSFFMLYYLYEHTQNQQLTNLFQQNFSIFLISVLMVFSFLNWYFEIYKWKYLASDVQSISQKQAYRQSLISFSISLLTPNRFGEYGVKVLFFPKEIRKKIFFVSLIGNISQLIITLFMGVSGIIFLVLTFPNQNLTRKLLSIIEFFTAYKTVFSIVLISTTLIALYFLKTDKKQLWQGKDIWLRSLNFSLLRYMAFSFQFLLLLQYFGNYKNLLLTYVAITIIYFLSSLIPMLSFLDWAVKGSVAVKVFADLGVSANLVLNVVALMWIVNFAIPFLVGMFLIWKTKIKFK